MRKITEQIANAFVNHVPGGLPGDSVWTDIVHGGSVAQTVPCNHLAHENCGMTRSIVSYHTEIVRIASKRINADRPTFLLNVKRYSNTTTTHQSGLRVHLAQFGDVVECGPDFRPLAESNMHAICDAYGANHATRIVNIHALTEGVANKAKTIKVQVRSPDALDTWKRNGDGTYSRK